MISIQKMSDRAYFVLKSGDDENIMHIKNLEDILTMSRNETLFGCWRIDNAAEDLFSLRERLAIVDGQIVELAENVYDWDEY